MGELDFDVLLNDKQFQAQLRNNEQKIMGFGRKVTSELSSIENQFSALGSAAAGALAFTELRDLGSKLITVRGEFQQLGIAFETMLGSKAKADKLFGQVVQLASSTPFGLKDAAAATKQLLAYGFASETVVSDLRQLGDIAAGVGAPIGDLAYLFGTLKAQGRAMTVDIRQFAGRGIPIYEELSKVLKVNVDQVGALVEAGRVGFPEVQKAFQAMTGEGGMFFNLMEKQSKSLTGLTSSLADAVDVMFNEIGKSQEGALTDSILFATSVVQNYEPILDILKVLVAGYGSYRAAIALTAALQATVAAGNAIQGYVELSKVVGVATAAQRGLNAAMIANPVAIAIAAIVALGIAVATFSDRASEAELAQEGLNKALEGASRVDDERKLKVEQLRKAVQDETLSQQQRKKALDDLIALSPQHLGSLTQANIATDYATQSINTYNKAMAEKSRQDVANDQILANQARAAAIRAGKLDNDFKPTAYQGLGLAYAQKYGGTDLEKESALITQKNKEEALKALQDANRKLLDEDGRGIDARRALRKEALKDQKSDAIQSVKDYEEQIKNLEDSQKSASSESAFKAIQKQIDILDAKRRAITGELTAEQKKYAKDAEKIGPFGSISYWENISQKAQEIIDKTPATNSALINSQMQIKANADKKAEDLRKQYAVKNFEQELTDKKTQYELYQRWVSAYGKKASDEQFSSLIKDNASYVDYLNSEISKLESKRTTGVLSKSDATNLDNLNVEKDAATGKKSAIDLFKEQLDAAAESTTSLTEQLEILKQKQSELSTTDNSSTGIGKRTAVADKIASVEKERKFLIQDFLTSVAGAEQRETAIRKKYADIRASLDEQTADKKASVYIKALADINNAEKNDLDEDKSKAALASKEYKAFQDLTEKHYSELKELDIKNARDQFAVFSEGLDRQSKEYKKAKEDLLEIENGYQQKRLDIINTIAGAASELGQIFATMDGSIGNVGNIMVTAARELSTAANAIGNLTKKSDKGGSFDITKITSIVSLITQAVGLVVGAAKKIKDAQRQYDTTVHDFRQGRAIDENEAFGSDTNSNPFYTDYDSMAQASIKQYEDALNKYNQSIEKLSGGKALTGFRGGFFRKDKNVYGDLLQTYPELVDSAGNLNLALAKTLVETNAVSGATKILLQDSIDWAEQMEKSAEALEGVIVSLVGQVGDSLVNAMVNGFEAGKDAAESWGQAVGDIIGNVLKQTVLLKILQPVLDRFEKETKESLSQGGDGNVIDDLERLKNYGAGSFEAGYAFMNDYNKWAEANGFGKIFGDKNIANAVSSPTPQQGVISGTNQESISQLNGGINAMRISFAKLEIATIDHVTISRNSLAELTNISRNTQQLYQVSDLLKETNRLLSSDILRALGGL